MIDPIIIIIGCLIVVIISSVCLIFSQKNRMQNLQAEILELKNIEQQYQELRLLNSKLEERCTFLQKHSSEYDELMQKYLKLEQENTRTLTTLEEERKNFQEKIVLLNETKQKLSETFASISSEALSKNNTTFLDLAKSVFEGFKETAKSDFSMSAKSVNDLVVTIKTALENVDVKLNELEKSRVGAYEALKQQVDSMIVSQNSLKNETNQLVSALKTPTVRGRWGEMQLHRVVELAGMLEHCDFEEQVEVSDNDTTIRPDMIIYLPGNMEIIVDSKAPLSAYLEALECSDEKMRKELFKKHAQQIRDHVSKLANKKYWSKFEKSPEFVIMFLPGEIFFSTATQYDMNLIEFAMQHRVLISTPIILLGLLHTFAQGWRQEHLAEDAKQIIRMGQELYQRLSVMVEHVDKLGRSINSSVQNYNATVASLETRVLSTARKFKDLEVHEKNIIDLIPIENTIRPILKKE